MNWLEFFFGWLIKGQYKVTMLDGIMFSIEFMIVGFVVIEVQDIKERIKKRKKLKESDK